MSHLHYSINPAAKQYEYFKHLAKDANGDHASVLKDVVIQTQTSVFRAHWLQTADQLRQMAIELESSCSELPGASQKVMARMWDVVAREMKRKRVVQGDFLSEAAQCRSLLKVLDAVIEEVCNAFLAEKSRFEALANEHIENATAAEAV